MARGNIDAVRKAAIFGNFLITAALLWSAIAAAEPVARAGIESAGGGTVLVRSYSATPPTPIVASPVIAIEDQSLPRSLEDGEASELRRSARTSEELGSLNFAGGQSLVPYSSKHSVCPKILQKRSAAEVFAAHVAALESGDISRVVCDYALDAVLIFPGTMAVGRDDIAAAMSSFLALSGGDLHIDAHSATFTENAILVEYTLTSSHVTITDAVETLIVVNGLIATDAARLTGFSLEQAAKASRTYPP